MGKKRTWSVEEKLRVVKRNIEDHIGQHTIAREEKLSRGSLSRWILSYLKFGIVGLENKKKPRK